MKISLKWLNDYVDVKDYFKKPEELGDLLTRAGLEVEEIINREKDFKHVVIGLILEKDKHPNADKLSLCKVTTGEGVVHQIVCGAQNHKANDRVVLALPGAVLPGNFAIKQAAVRGVESGGMLCSLKELGLAKESEGILILPENAPVGKDFAAYKGLDDVILELKVTPNRADCLSHFGLAREVACVLGRELKTPNVELSLNSASTKSQISLDVQNGDLCPRYAGRYVQGVKVGASPDWLKQRLEAVGLNSVNNIVDVTNYVMMELGQPLHAFDAAMIEKNQIIVGKAKAGEKFISLDGTEITLKGEELMIRDGVKALAMAGVVGGKNSGVSEVTTNIFVESAYFMPMVVRKTARAHGIETDSAYRFSRGVDPDGAARAMDRAAQLITQIAGGQAFADHHDFYPHPVKKEKITMTVAKVTERLGYQADEAKFVDFVKRLGCQINPKDGAYEILPPTFRFDLEMEMDFVEEYARLNGYEHIPDALPQFAGEPNHHDKVFILDRQTSEVLRAEGYQQGFNFAFVGSQAEKKFIGAHRGLLMAGLDISEKQIQILNPLNEEMNIMRSTLVFGLYENLKNNFHRGNHLGRLFEIGQAFSIADDGSYKESHRLAFAAWGQMKNLWVKESAHPVVFELKAAIENLLKSFNISAYTWSMTKDKGDIPDFIHRGQYAVLTVEGKKVGYIGSLHPVLLDEDKIRVPAAVAELDLDLLYKGQPRSYRSQSISKFPAVERDLAFLMPKILKTADVIKEIKKAAGPLLVSAEVFDVFEGDKVEAGKKSVAFRLIYQDKNATLQENQINDLQKKVVEAVSQQFGLSMR